MGESHGTISLMCPPRTVTQSPVVTAFTPLIGVWPDVSWRKTNATTVNDSELVERPVVAAAAIGVGEHMPRVVEALHRPFVVDRLRRCSVSTQVGVELPRSSAVGRSEFRVGSIASDAESVVVRHHMRPVMSLRISTHIVRTPGRLGPPGGSG